MRRAKGSLTQVSYMQVYEGQEVYCLSGYNRKDIAFMDIFKAVVIEIRRTTFTVAFFEEGSWSADKIFSCKDGVNRNGTVRVFESKEQAQELMYSYSRVPFRRVLIDGSYRYIPEEV